MTTEPAAMPIIFAGKPLPSAETSRIVPRRQPPTKSHSASLSDSFFPFVDWMIPGIRIRNLSGTLKGPPSIDCVFKNWQRN